MLRTWFILAGADFDWNLPYSDSRFLKTDQRGSRALGTLGTAEASSGAVLLLTSDVWERRVRIEAGARLLVEEVVLAQSFEDLPFARVT